MNPTCCLAVLSIALAVAACGSPESGDRQASVFRHIHIIDGDHIALAGRSDAADATIASDGSFAIDGKAVALGADQRVLMRAYYASAMKLRDDSIAIGKAGAAVAKQALGSVAAGLASGQPDKIGAQIDAKAAKVDAQARLVCDDLANLRSAQDAIAAVLPAFAPYATIDTNEVARCSS